MKYYTEPKYYDLGHFMKTNEVTYRELAKLTGVSYGFIHHLITGRHVASPEVAEKILYVCKNYKRLMLLDK